jgi:hypothetical protein
VIAATIAAAVALAAPQHGVLVPGRTLGGVPLGATPAQVTRTWGARHGVCRSCPVKTWYFTFAPFTEQGVAVAFRGNKAVAIYTLSSPEWKTSRGLALGDPEADVFPLYRPLDHLLCTGYDAWTLTTKEAVTAFYVYGGAIWGFGLLRPRESVCR